MQWDTCSLIRFDFSLIQFNPTTITWYPWRHRCERWLKKISRMVVRTWFWLWYYLCCIWFCSDWLSFSLLRDHIRCWHRHDQIAIVQDDGSYIPQVHRVLPTWQDQTTSHFVEYPLQPFELSWLLPDELRHLQQAHFEILEESLCGENLWLTQCDWGLAFCDLVSVPLVCIVGLQLLMQCAVDLALINPESFNLG